MFGAAKLAVMDTRPVTNPQDFARIEKAIGFIEARYRDQPALDEVAREVGLSPYHFQRLFTRWAGVSPKRFIRFLTVDYAKAALEGAEPVLDAAFDAGLSGPGRLHDLLVAYEAVTPGEYKAMGEAVEIRYGFHAGPFGAFLLAATSRGICALSFVGDGGREQCLAELGARWPRAAIIRDQGGTAPLAAAAFPAPLAAPGEKLRLWLKGTNFQVKVWEALLRIPAGRLTSYGEIAAAIGRPGAARAVGGALADNPVGWVIPCHRVIRASGRFETHYRWGSARKRAMIGWEAARAASQPGSSPSTSNMV